MNSLYIPRVYSNLCEEDVKEVIKTEFLNKGYGLVTHVELYHNTDYKNGSTFYKAYVYLQWLETEEAITLQETSEPYRIYLETSSKNEQIDFNVRK
jgi:hypothetical protein